MFFMSNTRRNLDAHWSVSDPKNPGWYIEETDENNRYLSDSMKIWFPIDVDQYGEEEGDELLDEMRKVFPNHNLKIVKPL